jgi:diguanylate cyclase (GGDEF)-like protein
VVALVSVLKFGYRTTEATLISSLQHNEREVGQLLDVAIAYNESVKEQLLYSFDLHSEELEHPLLSRLKNFAQLDAYGLGGNETFNGKPYHANLTGVGSLDDVTLTQLMEMNAVLNVNFAAPFQTEGSDFIWSYYTSKTGFMLLSPSLAIEDFQFSTPIYEKPFWVVAIPENNPSKQTQISDLYVDGAGEGLMISVSTPVYIQEQFKGVVSLDVGLEYLNKVLQSMVAELEDNISLITIDGRMTANEKLSGIDNHDVKFDSQGSHYQLEKTINGYYILSNLIKGRFYVVYQLSNVELYKLVLKNSYVRAVVVILFGIIFILTAKLFDMLLKTRLLAQQDGLSKLYNRITLEKLSNEVLVDSLKHESPTSVIMLDIDRFKLLNDEFGHHVGDVGIRHVASIIKRNVRKIDIVGRYGGEEFVITLPNTPLEQATLMAERIRIAIEQSLFCGDKNVTVSLGVTESIIAKSFSFQELCKKADLALYQAKTNGRNLCVAYSQSLESANKRRS